MIGSEPLADQVTASGIGLFIEKGTAPMNVLERPLTTQLPVPDYVTNTRLIRWVREQAALCRPDAIYWCDGSPAEYATLCDQLVASGTFLRLNPTLRPNSFLARSDPGDGARVEDRTFICWPGYGENMRVLKWIVERARGRAVSIESPIGWMPRYEDLDWRGLEDFSPEQFNALMAVDRDAWQQEILSQEELFVKLYDRLPKELLFIRELILSSLWRSPEHWALTGE